MAENAPLQAHQLLRPCLPEELSFKTTDELDDLVGTVGQHRAMEAFEVGLGIRREGYNIFVMGTQGVGKHTVVSHVLQERAAAEGVPNDLCFVYNYDRAHEPRTLSLPPGRGARLRGHMKNLVRELQMTIPAVFASDTYSARVRTITNELDKLQSQAFEAIEAVAGENGLAVVRSPEGISFAPFNEARDGVLDDDDVAQLPDELREPLEAKVAEMEDQLHAFAGSLPRWRKDTRDKLKALVEEVTRNEVEALIDSLRDDYSDLPAVLDFFDAVQSDIVEQVFLFQEADDGEEGGGPPMQMAPPSSTPVNLRRYEVNVLVDHAHSTGAPVIYEDSPDLSRLIGRIEHLTEMGMMVTDHTLIKPGVAHRANGGYLILDARRLVQGPFAWSELKRMLRAQLIRMDSPGGRSSLNTQQSLTPEAIPLDVKVVLLGDPRLYYELLALDPEFERHFKICAAFEEQVPRNLAHTMLVARLIATKVRAKGLRPLTASAVGRVIEEGAREVEDQDYVSANLSQLFNLLDEADYWAAKRGVDMTDDVDVDEALAASDRRGSQPRDYHHEAVRRGTILVDTDGSVVGQINGLAVVAAGNFEFGRPSRITATARVGDGEVVDIEREVRLSGSLHSKGVMIIQALLSKRYAGEQPLSLSGSLVFEQSYGMIDGDSASLAELMALLSAVTGIPILQSRAVTGSINQQGEIQAIGGVNPKIEGFFGLCEERGLTGSQGVVVPASNVKNLMLRRRVVDAATAGKFHVWAVADLDDAIPLLTGVDAETFNARVRESLIDFYEQRCKFARMIRDTGGRI